MSIHKTNIEIQKGDFSPWWLNKKRQDAYEQAEEERLKKDVRRLKEASRRTAGWSELRKLDFSRIQFEKDMADFSEGQKKKMLIARSLCDEAHIYIWDEPLNFIDVFSRMQIEELLLAYRLTLLFVERDREFAERIATKMVCLS